MSENKSRRIGAINFVGKIDIPSEAITVTLKSSVTTTGRHLVIDLKGVRDFPIPPSALVSIEVKDNVINEPNNFAFKTWGEIDRSYMLMLPVASDFHARRTSIEVLFVDPVNGSIKASSPLLHADDKHGKLKNTGETYIHFGRHDGAMPAKPVLDSEGPVIEFGPTGPADVGASETDLGFVHYGLPMCLGFFTSALIVAEDGYDTNRWNKFKSDIADWAGFEDWKSLRNEYTTSDKPAATAAEIVNMAISGVLNNRGYKANLKRMIAEAASLKKTQNELVEELKDAA